MAESAALQDARQFFLDLVPDGEPSMDDLRESYIRSFGQLPVPDDARIEDVDADGVSSIWVRAPGASDERCIVYYHGGGYCMGRAFCYKSLGYALSKAAEAAVLLVDYRLAPEHPFPAALDDAVTAYEWARKQLPDAAFALCGDSAGGGLATATTLALRDGGQVMPAACAPISPFGDLAGDGASMTERAHLDPIVSDALVTGLGGAYMGGKDPHDTPLASPVFATDFSRLPPFLIQVGTAECLYDDSIRLHEKMQAAGTDVELVVAEDMIHVWPIFWASMPEAQEAVDRIGAFVRKHC